MENVLTLLQAAGVLACLAVVLGLIEFGRRAAPILDAPDQGSREAAFLAMHEPEWPTCDTCGANACEWHQDARKAA